MVHLWQHHRRSKLLLRLWLNLLIGNDVFETRWRLKDAHVTGEEKVRALTVLAERGLARVFVTLGFLDWVHHVAIDLPIDVQVRELIRVIVALEQLLVVNRLPYQLVVSLIYSDRVRIARIQHHTHLVWVVDGSRLLERGYTYSASQCRRRLLGSLL